jgi:hypothetical protein
MTDAASRNQKGALRMLIGFLVSWFLGAGANFGCGRA